MPKFPRLAFSPVHDGYSRGAAASRSGPTADSQSRQSRGSTHAVNKVGDGPALIQHAASLVGGLYEIGRSAHQKEELLRGVEAVSVSCGTEVSLRGRSKGEGFASGGATLRGPMTGSRPCCVRSQASGLPRGKEARVSGAGRAREPAQPGVALIPCAHSGALTPCSGQGPAGRASRQSTLGLQSARHASG